MLAHVPSFGRNPRGSPDFLAYPVPKACMHVLGTGVPRRLDVACSASSPKAAQALGCSLTPGLRISFGRVTRLARAAPVPGLWTPGFLLLCCACVWGWVVVELWFRLRPATPGWDVGVCVCLRARSACTPPLLAGVCGAGVCAWARVPAAPHNSWPGCWGLGVFVCALRLYPATPGWGVRCGCVCLGSGFGCAPPLLAGVLGCVCACLRAPLVPRHSWLECAVWVCVLGLGFRLRPATPGWHVGCVCGCLHTPSVLCVSWLGCAVWVRVLGLGFWLQPATPGWGVGVCVCMCARFVCTPPLRAVVRGLGVCAWARVSAAPCHSWLACWGVCVLGARSACAPPHLARVCGVGVCVWARVVAAPRHSWLGCWGVRVCLRAPLVPRHTWPGCAVWACVFGLGLSLRPATSGWGVGVCVFV